MKKAFGFAAALLLTASPIPGPALCESPRAEEPASRSVADLRGIEEKVLAAARKALPAMVFIDGGSGVLISPDGFIITNHHVIDGVIRMRRREKNDQGEVELTVMLTGGRRLKAAVVGRDPGGDIALLKVREPGTYPFLELGDSDALHVGQWVLAMGNPFLLGESPFPFFAGPDDSNPSISLGVVSALHRSTSSRPDDPMYSDAIQVDAAVNPGSSGGPLLTTDGKVVGINGKIQTRQDRFLIEVNSGVGYAVPANQIARFLDQLKRAKGGVVRRGTILGILVAEHGDVEHGLEVKRVVASAPGERAGFRTGDRILSIEGQPVYSRRRFDGLISTYPAGSGISVKVDRGGVQTQVAAVLDRDAPARLGVMVETVDAAPGGVRISELEKEAPAERAGLQVGDVILKVDDRTIEDVVDLMEAIGDRRSGDTVKVKFRRSSSEEERAIRLDAKPDE